MAANEATSNVKPIPGLDRLKGAFMGTLKGFAAGFGVSLATAVLGAPVGTLGGTVLAASIMGGDVGQIVAVNGGMDSALALLAGGGTQEKGALI